MTEQDGHPDQADSDRPGQARAGSDRAGSQRAGSGRPASGRPGSGRPGSGAPGADILNEFQRWLIRSSARSMRKEIGGQVRKTFSGGRTESADAWDVATTEIPPEIGEAPECQWCPICRAARQLRESGPGIGGHISGAGNAVASAVQDAFNAFDSVLAKAAGSSDRDRQDRPRPDWPTGTRPDTGSSAPASRSADTSRTAERPGSPIAVTPEPIVVPGADSPETAEAAAGRAASARPEDAPESAASAGPTASAETAGLAGGAGPAGAAASSVLGSPAREPDAWSLVTDVADGSKAEGPDVRAGAEAKDGGHGPDDRS